MQFIQSASSALHQQSKSHMSRVISIGTDIHQFGRFLSILNRNGPLTAYKTQRFSERILNPVYELPKFEKYRQQNNIAECSRILSISWCVKEAIYKTLDDVDQSNFIMSHWYKINDQRGRPIIGNSNTTLKDDFLCSVSHDGDLVTAFVLRQEKNTILNRAD